jgi:hypothetical protein
MKSIMEEASSIIKAIEKAWIQAGQPQEFSIKIFEEPQKNFIGMTIRSAKVGIFFSDTPVQKPKKAKVVPTAATPQAIKSQPKPEVKRVPKKLEVPDIQQEVSQELFHQHTQLQQVDQTIEQTKPVVWSESMIQDIHKWLTRTLELLHKPTDIFTLEQNHFHLRIIFQAPIFDEKTREKQLFSSLATLFLQMLKQKYKRPLRGYKLVLIGA